MAKADPTAFPIEGMDQIPDPIQGGGHPRSPGARLVSTVPPARLPDAPAPTRAERRQRAAVALAIAAVWITAGALATGLRPNLISAEVLAPMAAWLLCGAAALGAVLRPRARGLPAGVRVVQHALWIVPAAYAVGAAIVDIPAGVPLTWRTVRFCLTLSSVMALGPLAAAALILRGSFFSAPGWRGAAVGALAGLAGSIGVHAHCPCQVLSHLLVAHGTAILLGAAAGAGLGVLGGRP